MVKDKEEKQSRTPFMSMSSNLVKLQKQEKGIYEKRRERLFKQHLESLPKEKQKEAKQKYEYQKEEKGLEELKRERKNIILKGVGQKAEQLSSKTEKVIMSLGKLGKPKAKLPSHSSKAFLKSLTSEHQALVRQVPEREQFEEPRSLFFKQEFEKEKRRSGFI